MPAGKNVGGLYPGARTTGGYSNTAGQHNFAQIPRADIERSVFNRSNGLKTSFDAGYLVPIYTDEALPGDTISLRTHSLVRMTTPLFPIMDNVHLDVFFFAVPNRLVWNNWQKFCGEQTDPGDSTDFTVPQFELATVAQNTLSDYLGLPLGANKTFNSLWHRGYNLIWNEWFRSQDLQDSLVVDLDDGPDTLTDYVLKRRGKRHDYFTSCLPFTQKGDPVTVATSISGDGTAPTFKTVAAPAGAANLVEGGALDVILSGTLGGGVMNWQDPHLSSSLGSINELREAFQIQRLLERDARGGTRYVEILQSHFQVSSPDARLQRPEYLGGGSVAVNIHPVANTNFGTTAITGNLAELGGFGTAVFDGVGFMKSFTEHCLIIGLANIRADLTYQQGMNRMFSRQTRYEFYWPALAHLGEQAVLNKEIFSQGTGDDELVFGYQERFAEYRYKPSYITGLMRSDSGAPIDGWHLAQDFAFLPVLDNTFIQDDPPFSRILAVPSPHFFGDFWFESRWARPMPTYSVPGLIDHF